MCYARRQRSSWARIKLSKKSLFHVRTFAPTKNTFSELFFLSFFLLFWVINSCVLTRFLHTFCSCSKFLLFNFQRPTSPRLVTQLFDYTTTFFICQPLFEKFFIFLRYLQAPSLQRLRSAALLGCLSIISSLFPFVNPFFCNFRQHRCQSSV